MTSIPAIALGAAIGLATGIGGYTLFYARADSYLTDDPQACVNCHVMREQFDGWLRASHRAVAVCNDCHTPHDVIAKFAIKARNGFWHSFYFTFGGFPDPITISDVNRRVVESACRHCHEPIVDAIEGPAAGPGARAPGRMRTDCTACHRDVGHPH
jgi:cytochrome c nitrite reductase small subunit